MINSGILFKLNWSGWPVLTSGENLSHKISKSKVYAISRWGIELLESSFGHIVVFDFDESCRGSHL